MSVAVWRSSSARPSRAHGRASSARRHHSSRLCQTICSAALRQNRRAISEPEEATAPRPAECATPRRPCAQWLARQPSAPHFSDHLPPTRSSLPQDRSSLRRRPSLPTRLATEQRISRHDDPPAPPASRCSSKRHNRRQKKARSGANRTSPCTLRTHGRKTSGREGRQTSLLQRTEKLFKRPQ